MGTFSQFCPETISLLNQYIYNCDGPHHFLKRRRIKEQIYKLELARIRKTLQENFDSIIQNIYHSENSRIYVNTAAYLLSTKVFSHSKFKSTIDPRSLKNNISRAKYKKIIAMLSDENISVFRIESKINKLSTAERAFICYISGTNAIEIFNILENIDNSRNQSNKK